MGENIKKTERYIAVMLDEESKTELSKFAIHPEIFAEHMTVVYEPTDDDIKKFERSFGNKIELDVLGVAQDDKGQAVLVSGFESKNKFPHVTISCNKVEAVYSNELLKNNPISPIKIKKVSGTLQLISS